MTTGQNVWMVAALCLLMAGGSFALDLTLPLEVAAGVPYVGVILVSLWFPRPRHVLYTALAVSALTVAGYFWSEAGGIQWVALSNRFFALFAIWATAIVGFLGRRAEVASRRISKVFKDSANAIVVKDTAGRIIDLNKAAERQYGWTRDELLGRSINMLVPPEEQARNDDLIARCLRGEDVRSVEGSRVTRSGAVLPVLLTFSRMTNEAGQPVGIATSAQDITELKQAERQLRISEERLRTILETAIDAIITIDTRGIIATVNAATCRIFGYTSDELIGQNVKILMPQPYRDEHDGYLARYVETGEARIIGTGREVMGRRKDGTSFSVDLGVSPMYRDGFTGILRDLSQRKQLERRLAESQTEERQQLARELHDGIGSQLTGIRLIGSSLANQLRKADSRLTSRAGELVQALDTVSEQVQAMTRGLMPVEVVPDGLMEALRRLTDQCAEAAGISCRFEYETPVLADDATTATQLFRIAQEAMNNAVRHAKAQHVTLALAHEADLLRLRIADDGTGFRRAPAGHRGVGLLSMEARCRALGGSLLIGSGKLGGTVVECLIPWAQEPSGP